MSNSTSATLWINKMFHEVVYMFLCLNRHVLSDLITPVRQHPFAGASKATLYQIFLLIRKVNISSSIHTRGTITVWTRRFPTASLPQRRAASQRPSVQNQHKFILTQKTKTSPRFSDKNTVYVFEDKSRDYGCHMWGKQSIRAGKHLQ